MQREGDGRLHSIQATACQFDHAVTDVVDDVGVAARAARHGVQAGAAVDHVLSDVAHDGIGQSIARAVDGRRADEGEVLDFVL
ncbi:DUF5812 family protein [Ideonella lacteola]|uniref:DUF5812 family protein n=1 Tax=Ideonella lacteola TaxID=2984193 RepID=UPI003BF9A973